VMTNLPFRNQVDFAQTMSKWQRIHELPLAEGQRGNETRRLAIAFC
jgi:hypothetical protein